MINSMDSKKVAAPSKFTDEVTGYLNTREQVGNRCPLRLQQSIRHFTLQGVGVVTELSRK